MHSQYKRVIPWRYRGVGLCGMLFLVISCTLLPPAATPSVPTDVTVRPEILPPTTPFPFTPQQTVLLQAMQAVTALKYRDMTQLAALAHPTQGVRFSPYAYVQDTDLVFTPEQLVGLFADPTIYEWGAYDGSGEPIRLSFADYFQAFVFDHDFTEAEAISLNARLGWGNSIDNSREYYSGAMVVEFHFSGFDPEFQGLDWASLRLVFQEYAGRWVLVGIIHDQWTI